MHNKLLLNFKEGKYASEMDLFEAIDLLKLGELVAFPTETVYGLGASIFDIAAIEKVFQVKGRPSDNPLIAHIGSLEQVEMIAEEIPEAFYYLAQAFFPGPLTVILPKKAAVPEVASGGLQTIGVRMPNHSLALELIQGIGVPLVAPSANLSGRPSCTTAGHVREDFGDQVAILDGGRCKQGIESTVLMLSPEPTILRPGMIGQEELEAVLGRSVKMAQIPISPGVKYRHYAPKARVRLISKAQTPSPKQILVEALKPEELYAQLRAADQLGYEEILIVYDEQTHPALLNRLFKAAE